MQSIDSKKTERLQKASTAYNDFTTLFPNSQYLAEARSMKEKSQKEIDLLGLKYQKKTPNINKKS
jgi:outer membrane protein assembly factor BamD (BamD/ComL family)